MYAMRKQVSFITFAQCCVIFALSLVHIRQNYEILKIPLAFLWEQVYSSVKQNTSVEALRIETRN